MAAEVPVSDVLADAMEYLCKLGSNLRTRSENLKEKRICNGKLKNAHAVQKAANKLLLICELSKKSLENVEVGVKKVLTLVTKAQQNKGGNDVSPRKEASDPRYHYFRHGGHKLRVFKKVPLKHYLSVQVKARRMPKSMLEKYPVYYYCKLYKNRQLEKQKSEHQSSDSVDYKEVVTSEENKENVSNSSITLKSIETEKEESDQIVLKPNNEYDKKNDSDQDSDASSRLTKEDMKDNSKPKKVVGDDENLSSTNDKAPEKQSVEQNSSVNEAVSDNESPQNNSDSMKPSESNEKSKQSDSNEDNKSNETKIRRESSNEIELNKEKTDGGDVINKNKENNNKRDDISDKDKRKDSNEQSKKQDQKDHKHKQKEKKRKPDSDNDNELKKSKNKLDSSKSNTDEEDSKDTIKSRKFKKIAILDDSESDTEDKNEKTTDNASINADDTIQLLQLSCSEKPKEKPKIYSDTDEQSQDSKNTHDVKNKESDDTADSNSESKKPMIKCVSLNKLLKPEIADTKSFLGTDAKRRNSKEQKDRHGEIRNKQSKEKRVKFKDDEDYWEHKRKEVKEFKPKNFIVNVTRLPKFSFVFLETHNIKKITREGDLVFGIQETDEVESSVVENVKSALLNDSDSSSETRKCTSLTVKSMKSLDKSKQALLIESDPEVADKDINKLDNKTNVSDEKSNAQDNCINTEEISNISKNAETESSIKSALLNDSPEDKVQTTPSKKRAESTTPQSKRKHIMESMHAKKMLLTYSSSSDTEDEQLRSALKEIKDDLLKGISSGDESSMKQKESFRRKLLQSSSDSEEDILKRLKKKKNLRNTKLKDSETEEEKVEAKIDEKDDPEQKVKSQDSAKESEKLENRKRESSVDNSSSSTKKIGRRYKRKKNRRQQNLETPDSSDKDIDGLTNLKTLTRLRRRRGSTASDNTQDTDFTMSSGRGKRMPKAPKIEPKEILKAESESDAASAASDGDDGDDEVVLPPVSLTGLNGDGPGHLAKDDLLGESDSSDSQDEEVKNSDDEDEDSDNIKSKRRKANTISSDSDGPSKKKDKTVKMSDFEDSEDETSGSTTKKKKKRKKGSDSDDGDQSSDGKKRRRRIKQLDSEGSDSDSENEGRNKHGRKNIRKVMGKDQLEEATKKAAREEKERMARIIERQKLYNNLQFDESGKPDEVVLDKVVLDFDPETKEPLIQVDKGLVKKLKPHQANGIKFMWDACFESVKRIKKDRGSGCILAHCMGLGKTLQVISLTHTLLTHGDLTGVKRVLVVCPLSTVLNWVNEFNMWLKNAEADFDVDIYELSRHKQNSERAYQLQSWLDNGGVCVLGYEMFRNLSSDNNKKYKKKMLKSFQESLVDPGPDLVVCDEGHLLKNEKTSLSQAMNRVKTHRRIVLTGTPLQNNLKEYYCMVQFVKPNLLGKYNEYLNRFVNPITNGQYTDSTDHDIKIMKRRSHVLHKMLDGAVQRRDYGVLAPFLPPKHEYVLFITLAEVQIKFYQHYLDNYSRRPQPGKSSGFLFPDFQSLQRIWTHPLVLKYNSERYEIMQQKKREKEEEEDSEGSLVDFIDDDSTGEESTTEDSLSDLSDVSDDSRKKSKKKKAAKKSKSKESKANTRRGTRANPIETLEDEKPSSDVEEVKNDNPTEWWIPLVTDDELEDMRNSHKLVLLFDILRQCEAIGDKLLVFSQSLYSLDLIEHFLGKVDEATQEGRIDEKLGGHMGSWSPGVDYFRLDGSTSCENRSIWCKNFNREDNPRARLFLISTRAGGLGINLVAANRVIIFDVSWNPSHDVQSIFRVYRFGQKKPCYVYRFLAMGTMEEKIYERQVTKQAISKRVIDEQQIDRHYAENDLAELYKFEPKPPEPRPIPPLPKDRLFAEMLKEHDNCIYKYHEHDSLLENKEEETLTEEERKAAWEDFENEKNRPPPAPFPSPWTMHNGFQAGLLQQQQMAYAAIAAMLRKDMPNVNDQTIRDMLPMIYNSNPALMQKMSEMYKYAQPGLLNPMMNPALMNPAGGEGAVMGGGGSSGLQYEPPWQRQQQQQQLMRLQQLMQHRNMQPGASQKYYAGGLGSRDPVAMALQQQRSREMMLERGRPRGRPPLSDMRPQPASNDVVNLDSD